MAERQQHGFIYQDKYILKNNLTEEKNYTHKNDAYDKNNIPYQIKTIKKNSSIDMGDIFRNANKNEDFYLVVGFWENKKTNIVEEKKLFIDHKKWNSILNFQEYDKLKDWIKNKVSNDRNYDNQWKKEMKIWKEKFGERKINIRFKRDHKKQRRIQCAINNKIFYSYFVKEFEVE